MPSSLPATATERLAIARVGRLATVTAAGRPHVVPVCFASVDGRIYTAVDDKPKTTRALARLDNVAATGRASLLVDDYEEDWSRLWWVRVDGPALVLRHGPEREEALDGLVAKYDQYRDARPSGAVIRLTPETWRSWPAIPSGA
jgi:PPOX class probable F420-dependent enzyme